MVDVRALLFAVLLAGCSSPEVDRQALKEELKREILAELATETVEESWPVTPVASEATPIRAPTGDLVGKVLFRDEGLAHCRVRAIRLEAGGGIFSAFAGVRETAIFETLSGVDGAYRFESIPVGDYRLAWYPPGETGWIRRLSTKPDVRVEKEQEAVAPEFVAGRTLLAD